MIAPPVLCLLLGSVGALAGINVNWNDENSVKMGASTIAYDLMSYYQGNLTGQIPGILPGPPPGGPYYWWEGGALWGTMMDYWHYTGDTTYNAVTEQAMLHQTGPNNDYMPPNWTASLGNDDQGFWGMSAMLGAENKFPNPPAGQPQWLALAQGVFNTMASPARHDNTCGGGLRWQIPVYNAGYNYKNSIANGCFFNIGARLARYTGNHTYSDWAEKTWDWEVGVGFMDSSYHVYDGASVDQNCTVINKAQFSYNSAVWVQGAAFMYNHTNGSSKWETRVTGLLDTMLGEFFPNGIATEVSCQNDQNNVCTTDELTFKGFDTRWLATVAQVAPFTANKILPALQKSAKAAVTQCTGGNNGRMCGYGWASGKFDGTTGAGQEMSALGAVIASMYPDLGAKAAPVTNNTGGTSQGNPNAGGGDSTLGPHYSTITTGSKAGAGIITTIILVAATGTFAWMSTNLFEGQGA